MKTRTLPAIEVATGENPSATIIWLHGLGADGHDFEPIVPQLGLPDALNIRFVFPHAPSMPVSINGGFIMPAWYDIKHTDIGYQQDESGIRESARQIQLLIEREELRGIASDRIILAGFSQGGAMALHVGMSQGEPLAGLLALSCYLRIAEKVEAELFEESKRTPMIMAHGGDESVVQYARGTDLQQQQKLLGYAAEWQIRS